MASLDLTTSGMHCGGCSMRVKMALEDLPGVESAEVDHASGATHVEYDDGALTVEQIVAAIAGEGYTAAPAA